MANHRYKVWYTDKDGLEQTFSATLGGADDDGGKEEKIKQLVMLRAPLRGVDPSSVRVEDLGVLEGEQLKRAAGVLSRATQPNRLVPSAAIAEKK